MQKTKSCISKNGLLLKVKPSKKTLAKKMQHFSTVWGDFLRALQLM